VLKSGILPKKHQSAWALAGNIPQIIFPIAQDLRTRDFPSGIEGVFMFNV
jgi:hypothetical protein